MDRPNPEPPEAPEPPPIPERLRQRAGGEPVVAWARGWVSHEQRLHRLFAARTLDAVVLTERELVLVTTGFLTRRPGRRVYAVGLDALTVTDVPVPRGRRLVVASEGKAPIRLELRPTGRANRLADALLAHTHR